MSAAEVIIVLCGGILIWLGVRGYDAYHAEQAPRQRVSDPGDQDLDFDAALKSLDRDRGAAA